MDGHLGRKRTDLEMDATTIQNLVEQQLAADASFRNMHGITISNVRSRLVEPFETIVDPDDLESSPRPMWVVLQEHHSPYDGYVVVYDPEARTWGVADLSKSSSGQGTLTVSASTLFGALDGM